eukprot:scaffold193709_cov30-Tisochrysis_lutea.AAC.1
MVQKRRDAPSQWLSMLSSVRLLRVKAALTNLAGSGLLDSSLISSSIIDSGDRSGICTLMRAHSILNVQHSEKWGEGAGELLTKNFILMITYKIRTT